MNMKENKTHTYYFRFMYDGPNSVTGKFERGWTGLFEVQAETYDMAIVAIEKKIADFYPKRENIRNIKRRI
jgi:hypothetical protein